MESGHTATRDELEAVADELGPLDKWSHDCHRAASWIVGSRVVEPARVARGMCEGVSSQHSWVILGDDCYDQDATIIDPTLWSYDPDVSGIWTGTYRDGRHHPHAAGQIWHWGRPENAAPGQAMELTPREPWSRAAEDFLRLLGPLDRAGWAMLAHAPMEGWPSGEIIDAMVESGLEAVIPIDIVGMVTDRNPSGLYLPK